MSDEGSSRSPTEPRTPTDARRDKFLQAGCPEWEAEILARALDQDSEMIRKAIKDGCERGLLVSIFS